jgi:hypothetical protein
MEIEELANTPRHRRKGASEYLERMHGISRTPKTLAKIAVTGGGPAMEYDGRIPLYTPASLDEYASRVLSGPVNSTAELAALKREAATHPFGGTQETDTAWSARCRVLADNDQGQSLANSDNGKEAQS